MTSDEELFKVPTGWTKGERLSVERREHSPFRLISPASPNWVFDDGTVPDTIAWLGLSPEDTERFIEWWSKP